jgi:hypothetical protein
LDKLLAGMGSITDAIGKLTESHKTISKRLDDLEAARGEPGDGKHLPMHGGTHRGATVVSGDGEDTRSRDEKRAGKPKPVVADYDRTVADGWRAHPDGTDEDNLLYGHGSRHDVLFSDAQVRADAVCTAWSRKSMPPMQSESLLSYRRRLLRPWLPHCEKFKDIDVDTLRGTLLDGVEKIVFSDAITASNNPAVGMGDVLIPRVKVDDTGRRITEWFGQPRAWMQQFAGNRRRVVSFRNVSMNP